jgi:hypothetical protein
MGSLGLLRRKLTHPPVVNPCGESRFQNRHRSARKPRSARVFGDLEGGVDATGVGLRLKRRCRGADVNAVFTP